MNPALALLQAGVPLTLLLDLAHPNGPDSHAILTAEARSCDRDAAPAAGR